LHPPKEQLRSKELYNRVHRINDVTDMYYLAAKHMDCRSCKSTFVACDLRILDQLPAGVRARFPIVLTYKNACNRAHTLCNSSEIKPKIPHFQSAMLFLTSCLFYTG